MNLFLKKVLIFILIIILLLSIPFIIPVNESFRNNMIYSKIDKDSLLNLNQSNRLILIGGSNVSFGINSYKIKKFTNLNPINTAIHANIGLYNMLNNTEKFLRQGDIVIIMPEYEQFFDTYFYGGDEYFITTFEVDHYNFQKLHHKQIIPLIKFFPKYNLGKYNYFAKKKQEIYYYRKSFNIYGDEIMHYNLNNIEYTPTLSLGNKINYNSFVYCKNFTNRLLKKGIKVYFSFPSLDISTYLNCKNQILTVVSNYNKYKLPVLGNFRSYIFNDMYFFNTRYHLNYKGVQIRTNQFISDLKQNNVF